MPSFNRRGFLQLLSAAGAAPLLPAMPATAAAARAGAAASASKALWAGIYAKSGSVPKFVAAARSIGLPDAAIKGVGARSVGVRVAVAAAAQPASQIATAGRVTPKAGPKADTLKTARKIISDMDRALLPDAKAPEAKAPAESDDQATDNLKPTT